MAEPDYESIALDHADPITREVFRLAREKGVQDIHGFRAEMEGISRKDAKDRNFLALYGGSAQKMAAMTKAADPTEVKADFDSKFPDLARWLKEQKDSER